MPLEVAVPFSEGVDDFLPVDEWRFFCTKLFRLGGGAAAANWLLIFLRAQKSNPPSRSLLLHHLLHYLLRYIRPCDRRRRGNFFLGWMSRIWVCPNPKFPEISSLPFPFVDLELHGAEELMETNFLWTFFFRFKSQVQYFSIFVDSRECLEELFRKKKKTILLFLDQNRS